MHSEKRRVLRLLVGDNYSFLSRLIIVLVVVFFCVWTFCFTNRDNRKELTCTVHKLSCFLIIIHMELIFVAAFDMFVVVPQYTKCAANVMD